MPAKGIGIRAADKPFSEYRRKTGDSNGFHWRIPSTHGTRELRAVHIDTNFWKTFVHARLTVATGDPGCLSLFSKPADHRLLAEHLTAEYRVKTEGRGRVVDDWKSKAGAVDNHWLDCLVGAAVAASTLGVALAGMDAGRQRKRKRYTQQDFRRTR